MTFAIPVRALAVLVALLSFGAIASAQVPKAGKPYERSDLGFRVKTPAEWELIPPQPSDPHVLAKFDPPSNKYVTTGPNLGGQPSARSHRTFLSCWLLKFDRRQTEADAKGKTRGKGLKDITEWVQKAGDVEFGSAHKLLGKKELSLASKIPATEYQYATEDEDERGIKRVYAVVYTLAPDLDVAVVFTGPGVKSKWPKYESVYESMARSFAPIEMAAAAKALGADSPLRDRERAKQQAKVDALGPPWKLYETPNYFVITPHADREFVKELCDRVEAIRVQFEIDYPYEKAKELREAGAAATTGMSDADKRKKELERKVKDEMFGGDPREASRCSVVRVFSDRGAYLGYGAPAQSAGYWSPMDGELVMYDDQGGGGRRETWDTLNHEAFHQYIFYLYGNVSPHSWYNEGTGDFYGALEYKNKRFTLKANQGRRDEIKAAIQQKLHVPLVDFVRMNQQEYYGTNKWNASGLQNYAQGWSFIYFLRTGAKQFPKNWDPAWDGILEKYFRVLAMSGDLNQAVTEAFQGIDMDALEKAWIESN